MKPEPRTSLTHPLRIDDVQVPSFSGTIGMTLCPGRRDRISVEGEWARDLDLDLDAVALWKPDFLVALLQPQEFKQLGIPAYAERVYARGLTLEMLPIADGGTPDAAFEKRWETVGPLLRQTLRKGGRVLLHCRAGLGRTGTIAARLLVELGSDPQTAIKAVRLARPNTIETGSQEHHVRQVQPVHDVDSVTKTRPMRVDNQVLSDDVVDRALGCLIGLAIGDALGTTLEFTKRDSHAPLTDIVGGGPFSLQAGQWTDDMSMALCLADSLIAFPELNEEDLMERFVRWRDTGENSATGVCFDIGATTTAALTRFKKTGNAIAGSTDAQSAGNGSLMRLAPVALRWNNDSAGAASAARRQSATTHGAPAAVEACAFFADVLVEAIAIGSKADALKQRSVMQPDVDRVAHGSWNRERAEIRSTGYVIDTLEAAFWAVSRASCFEDAVLLAANLGDDADTVAAVAGQLAGAIWGLSAIPERWLKVLAQRERIEALGKKLLKTSVRSRAMSFESTAASESTRPDVARNEAFGQSPHARAPEPSGHLEVGEEYWYYAQRGGIFEMWGPDVVLFPDLAVAARAIRAELESDLMTPRLTLLPSTFSVLGQVFEPHEVRKILDDVLQIALRMLGIEDGGRDMCSYGMPSEYRGWLAYARSCAEKFLETLRLDNESFDDKKDLAREVVASTHAVAFSMRYGHATLPFATAVAVASLREYLPKPDDEME